MVKLLDKRCLILVSGGGWGGRILDILGVRVRNRNIKIIEEK